MKAEKILLIDDDADDQFIFLDALKEIGYLGTCAIANNGVEGLSLLQNDSVLAAVIFLDLNMPLMNGFEFLVQLKNQENLSKIPVVIFSTSDNPADIKRISLMGDEKFITKSPDFAMLKADLLKILNPDPTF